MLESKKRKRVRTSDRTEDDPVAEVVVVEVESVDATINGSSNLGFGVYRRMVETGSNSNR